MDTTLLEDRLSNLFYRSDCPDVEVLRDYQLELLDIEKNKIVDQHVGICPHCAAELAELIEFIIQPEPAFERKSRVTGLGNQLRTVIATVSEAWRTAQAQEVYRSDKNVEPPRSFWFNAEGTVINLEWRPDDHGRYRVYGQVLGGNEGDQLTLTSVIETVETNPHIVALDEESSFEIDAVEGGMYQVTIRSAEQKIVIPAVTISQLPTE